SSNVRYRLALSIGRITDMAQDGGAVTGQSLAAGDMRYYRVRTAQSGAGGTSDWHIDLLQQQGDVIVFLREDVPPGFTNYIPSLSYPEGYVADWYNDRYVYN